MNNSKTKIPRYIIGIITAVTAMIVVWVLTPVLGTMVGLLVGLVVAGVVYMVLNSVNEKDAPPEITEEPISLSETSIESLLAINIALRKETIPEEVRALYESIIDQLIEVLPTVNSEVSGGELAWVINRMATEYLPEKSIKPYLAMDASQRHAADTILSVKDSIAGMQSELSDVQNMLSSHKTDEFNNKAKFLKARFKM